MRLVVTGCVLTLAALGVACGGRPLESPTSATSIAGFAGQPFVERPTLRDVWGPRADVDLTGTWALDGEASLLLWQIGGNLTGSGILPAFPPGTTVTTNSISGNIAGHTVSLTASFAMTISLDGFTMTTTGESRFALQVVDSSTMTGSATTTTVCTGDPLCPPTQTKAWSGTLTRATDTTPRPPAASPCTPFPECLADDVDRSSTFELSPKMESIGTTSLCSGGQISGTVRTTGLEGLTWTAELGWSAYYDDMTASIDRTSGTVGGTVTITITGKTVPLTSCTHLSRSANTVKFRASNGEERVYVVLFGFMRQGP